VGRFTSIAIDSHNNPHISYWDVDKSDLKYAYWNGEEWITETVDSAGSVGIPTAMVLDSSDHPHIAYHDFIKKCLKYAYYDGSKWNIETVGTDTKLFGHLSITLDENENPHIACVGYDDNTLKHVYYDGNKWHIETVDGGNVGWFSIGSIFVDNGNIHIIYGNGNELKHAYYDGNKWNIETIDDAEGEICYPAAVIDSEKHIHACYFVYGSNDSKYAFYDGESWNVETFLPHTATEMFIAGTIAVDSNDLPHVAFNRYVKNEGNDQGYAYYDGSKWNVELIDTEGNVGGCWSIAIDANDNPVISYFNWDFGDLKCARKTENNPPSKPLQPRGFKMGKVGWNFTYKTSATDADGDELYYMFDWGDGSISGWLGPYKSGETVKVKHAWKEESTYMVRVKAKDIHYSETPWSDPLPVTMPKTFSYNIIRWLIELILCPFSLF